MVTKSSREMQKDREKIRPPFGGLKFCQGTHYLPLTEQPVILKKFLKVLGDNSFGIYLCHMLIIRILNKLVPMANVFPINAIFVIMISTVCVMMAHRILGKYAYVIGV